MSDEERIRRLEEQVALLYRHLGLVPAGSGDPASDAEVIALINSGNKISAIKRYRELTGLGLAEAKEAIERAKAGG